MKKMNRIFRELIDEKYPDATPLESNMCYVFFYYGFGVCFEFLQRHIPESSKKISSLMEKLVAIEAEEFFTGKGKGLIDD